MTSLKILVENWSNNCITAAALIPDDIQVTNVDSDDASNQERIVSTATIGEQLLEGDQPFQALLKVELRTTTRSASEVDEVFAAIEASYAAQGTAQATGVFAKLQPYPEQESSDAERSNNQRARWREYKLDAIAV